MSVRSQRLRGKTPTSYVKYNLDFDQSIDDEHELEEESSDTFHTEAVKPAFSLKINRKLRHTMDLVDLSPNKDEEFKDLPKSIMKTPTSTVKKARKKASQFLPKVDKINYDPVEPVRKLVKAKRRLERQDHVEEECDKYFNFKIEEEIGVTQPEEIATNDEHVLAEVRTPKNDNDVQYELQADNVQSASRRSSTATERLNKTSKTPKSATKNERFTPKSVRESQKLASSPNDLLVVAEKEESPETPQNVTSNTRKSATKSGRFTTKGGRRSQRLASSRNDLVLAEREKSPEIQQNVLESEHTLEMFEDETTEALPADSTAVTHIVEYEVQSRNSQLGRKSQKCETLELNAPGRILSNSAVKNERSPLKRGRSQNEVERASSTNDDLVVAKSEESSKTPKNVAKTVHVSEEDFEHETGDLQADAMATTCDTPKMEICQDGKSTKKSVERSNRISTATEIVEVKSTTLESIEKKRQSRTSKIGRMSQKGDKGKKAESRGASVDGGEKQDEVTKNTPQSIKKNTPKKIEKKEECSIAEEDKSLKCDDTFNVNESPQNIKSTRQTPKSGNKSNHRTNIPENERDGTGNSFDMFNNSTQADTTFNVEETLTVSRENSIKTYGRKSKDPKRNSKQNSSFEKKTSLVSTPQAVTDFNIGKEKETKINVSGKQMVSLNKKYSTGSKSNRDSMQLDRSSTRSTSLSKTPRNKLSEVSSLKRTTPSSVAKPKRESIIARKRWSMRSNSFSMHLTDNDSINLVSSSDLKRKMSLNTPDNAGIKRQGGLRQNVVRKSSVRNTPLTTNKSLALIRNSASSTPITKHNQFEGRTSIFEELSMSDQPTDLLDTTTPPNDISYEPDPEEVIATEDSTIKPKKRRTFELDSSVNDISTLKLASRRDSKRMSGVVKRSSISTPSSASRFNGSTIILDDSSIDSSNSVIFVGEYFENKKSISLNDVNNDGKADGSFDVPIERFQKRRSRSLDNVCGTVKKSSMFFMPGQHVSTPMPKNVKTRKDSLLKQVLSATKAAQSVSAKKPVTRARNMPNFALIHQRAFDKMEDIVEHKQRKDERARDLLSGKKPPPNNDEVTPQRSSSIKKKLRFADDTAEKEKPADFIPLPNTPRPQKTSRRNSSVTSSSKESTPLSLKSKIAIPNFAKNLAGAFQGNKENDAGLKNAWKPPPAFTKFGFAMKAPSKPIKERAEVKAVIEKTRTAPVNDPKKRRNLIKGVRSNRRFDLLMQMRNKRE